MRWITRWSSDLIEALTAWSLPGLAALTADGAGCLLVDVNSIVHSERYGKGRKGSIGPRTAASADHGSKGGGRLGTGECTTGLASVTTKPGTSASVAATVHVSFVDAHRWLQPCHGRPSHPARSGERRELTGPWGEGTGGPGWCRELVHTARPGRRTEPRARRVPPGRLEDPLCDACRFVVGERRSSLHTRQPLTAEAWPAGHVGALAGLAIGAHTWWPMPTVAEMTPGEFNFVLTSDAFLDHFHRPEERHVAMECVSVLGMIHHAQPEVG